jgi:hypothetical protein
MNYQDMVRQLMAMMQQQQAPTAGAGSATIDPSMREDFEMPERPQQWQRPLSQYGGPHGFENRNASARQSFYAPMQSRAAMPKGRFFN